MRRQYSFQEKKEIVLEIIEASNTKDACVTLGISRANFYRWRRQVAEAISEKNENICVKTRRPKRLARSTPKEIKQKIIGMASTRQYKSAHAIAKALSNEYAIHTGTVIRILEDAGFYGVIEARDSKGRLIKKRRGIIYGD